MEYSKHLGLKLPSRDIDDAADINVISENFEILDERVVTNDMVAQVYNPKKPEPISGVGVAEAITGAAPYIGYKSSVFPDVISVDDELKALELESSAQHDSITGAYVKIDNVENDLTASLVALKSDVDSAKMDSQIAFDKTTWKVISSGEVDANSGGAPRITAELKENIADFREFRFYLEIPTGSPTGTSTTMYVNAVIDNSNPAARNCLLAVSHSGTPTAGKATKTIALANVVTAPDGTKYIQSVANQLTFNYGTSTRVNPLSTLCLWDVSDSSKNLTINIANYNFESGTKWILEGR